MPNIASLLKAEIIRLARKEVRNEVAALRKASAAHRREIAALKREISTLKGKAKALAKQATRKVEAAEPVTKARFSAKGLHSLRTKLGLSAAGMAKLLGVSQQSVYNWESKKTVPRPGQVTAIAALRSVGKRDAQQRLHAAAKKVRGKA
jgi:DNA-binding transcriptional regulator YiaG